MIERNDVGEERPPRKEHARCCAAKRDDNARLPIGFCSPDCVRRPDVWRGLLASGAAAAWVLHHR